MRQASFPNFRKLYRRVNHVNAFKNGLPAGDYTLHVQYSEYMFIFQYGSCSLYKTQAIYLVAFV